MPNRLRHWLPAVKGSGPTWASSYSTTNIKKQQILKNVGVNSIQFMQSIRPHFFVALACLAIGAKCFTPALKLFPLKARSYISKFQTCPLRMAPRTEGFNTRCNSRNMISPKFQSETSQRSKADRLRNAITTTDTVEVYTCTFVDYFEYFCSERSAAC